MAISANKGSVSSRSAKVKLENAWVVGRRYRQSMTCFDETKCVLLLCSGFFLLSFNIYSSIEAFFIGVTFYMMIINRLKIDSLPIFGNIVWLEWISHSKEYLNNLVFPESTANWKSFNRCICHCCPQRKPWPLNTTKTTSRPQRPSRLWGNITSLSRWQISVPSGFFFSIFLWLSSMTSKHIN